MIRSVRCPETARLANDQPVAKLTPIERAARRKYRLEAVRVPPGNRLEALRGNRAGQHSLRINRKWRVCFRWVGSDAYDFEIVDYH
jgi:proteic killer suppression protein